MPGVRMDATNVTDFEAFQAFLAAHPGIGTVIVYDSRFPQRPISWDRFVQKHVRKIWPEIGKQWVG
jgi:hypothetical protein